MKAKRAKPLSPDQRRAAILDAVIPLFMEHGAAVTTAEMAEAAGIAEGTIFRVFPDKNALIHAAIETAMDPAPICTAVGAIDDSLPVEAQVAAATDILTARFESIASLMSMLRSLPHSHEGHDEVHRIAKQSTNAVAAALTQLFARHHDRLQVEPAQAALMLRNMAFTNVLPHLSPEEKISPEQMVSALCFGIVSPETN
ncbi:MAG: TetR/AcrR family transcriptional regulator [bacterium]|nr:TetR/AcrR family transcriptional regulator [bacterium]